MMSRPKELRSRLQLNQDVAETALCSVFGSNGINAYGLSITMVPHHVNVFLENGNGVDSE